MVGCCAVNVLQGKSSGGLRAEEREKVGGGVREGERDERERKKVICVDLSLLCSCLVDITRLSFPMIESYLSINKRTRQH